MIDIYRAFAFLIITFEWMVWLRMISKGVILIHVDTFQPIFSKIRQIIKRPIVVNAPAGAPLLVNPTAPDQSQPQTPKRHRQCHDTITDCLIKIHMDVKYPFKGPYRRQWDSSLPFVDCKFGHFFYHLSYSGAHTINWLVFRTKCRTWCRRWLVVK